MKISVKKLALAMALTAMPMMGFAGNKGPEWLSKAVAYQIYPSSYQDSDGDGIGDIPGITSRLDYIKGLGVNVIWLNPVFVSGWFDGGYDIIGDLDGVLEEFDRVVGLKRLRAIHINDSKNPPASHKDRHELIGQGFIGLAAFERIINHPTLRTLPFYLETPNDLAGYAQEIALLKGLCHPAP